MLAETGFAARKPLWGNVGVTVQGALNSREALEKSGLNWTVRQEEVYTAGNIKIPDAFVNIRDKDNKPLGIVGKRYHVIQNTEAFEFTDSLIGEGVTYETAGALKGGKQIWLLAKMPENYSILGDEVEPYTLFTSSHDGSGSIRVAVTSVRVICQNTLNLALKTAKRTWAIRHTKTATQKIAQARQTLQLTDGYMRNLQATFENLYQIKVNKDRVVSMIDELVPIEDDMPKRRQENLKNLRSDILYRYEAAPDLQDREETGARFIQAVADTTSHKAPDRDTKNWEEIKLMNMANKGNDLLDSAMKLVQAVA